MSETTILVSEQMGLLFAEQFSGPDDHDTALLPYELGPTPDGDTFFDEGDGD